MKRLRSSEDLDSYGEKNVGKESVSNRTSSSSHRSFYYKPDGTRKGLSSSSARYERDRSVDDDRECVRVVRKRSDHDFEGFDRRRSFNRYRDSSSGCDESRGYGGGGVDDRIAIHRSDSFSGSRREFPKGFRSERDRSRREGSVSSWRRFGSASKEFDDGVKSRAGCGGLDERTSSRSSPKGSRDVKSPTWSRDSSSEKSKLKASPVPVSMSLGDEKSKSKSPTLSKDSGSEQSKSVDVKKGEELSVDNENGSEMEEGELEPEPEAEVEAEAVPKSVAEVDGEGKSQELAGVDNDDKQVKSENQDEDTDEDVVNKGESVYKGDMEVSNDSIRDEKDVAREDVKLSNCQSQSIDEMGGGKDGIQNVADDDGEQKKSLMEDSSQVRGYVESEDMVVEKSVQLEVDCKQEKDIDLEVKAHDMEVVELNKEVMAGNEVTKAEASKVGEGLIHNIKDKGKSVAVMPFHEADSAQDCGWIGREANDSETCRDFDVEGPSTRGFELFSRSSVRRQQKADRSGDSKPNDGKLALEPLDLSLSLPNVLLPIGASGDSVPAPGSPSQARSVQSLTNTFHTNSDGFTASMSFSGSQSFFHNPSCSLTHSMDNFEQSVKSRPIFQGIDQASQGQSQNDSKHKDIPLYQRILMSGNGSNQALHGASNGQTTQGQYPLREGSSKMANGLDRQLSFHRQLSGQLKYNDNRSPSQSVGSHDVGSTYSFEKKRVMREKSSGSLYRSASMKEQEKPLMSGADYVDTVIAKIVSEPVDVMARKFTEMTGQVLACLKDSIREIISNSDKRRQLYLFQKTLQNRFDMTLDMLLKSHRAQLEILLALKTGIPDFLKLDNSIASSDLAEIFLNLRCRNLTCRNLLPVDECDCKVCAQKNGFCSACMCLVCSKFDMASNTCSWVGCDVCLHWCHADCALRDAYIRNGCSATGAQGTTEMQFHCVACDHPSEMFGFVKEVFQNFAKDWTAETLLRELEYVKRIFSGSKDIRGRQLHQLADKMLERLTNKSNLPEVYDHIMAFLTDADSSKLGKVPLPSTREQAKGSSGLLGPIQEAPWLKSLYTEKVSQFERVPSRLPSFNYERNDKRAVESELPTSSQREPLFDELDSIVRIKLAEAKMFQTRADDARREAEGLKRIAIAKNEKIEEEYTSRIAKLRLAEAEEMRKRKIEELQALDRAHREYSSMKMRMEADIRDLLSKMEATKRNLAV